MDSGEDKHTRRRKGDAVRPDRSRRTAGGQWTGRPIKDNQADRQPTGMQ